MAEGNQATRDCPPERVFVDLLEGRLAEATAARLQRHAATCAECAELCAALPAAGATTGAQIAQVVAREVGAAADRVGRTLDRKYRLARLIGEGGMGSVYEAEHTATGRRVAVKVIQGRLLAAGDEARRRFRREARAAGAADSEHIVEVLDAGEDVATGDLYMVMEYLRGEDLQHLVDRVGPLAPEAALRVAAQALVGLAAAHEAGIIHRDIKPANLFLVRRDDGAITVKLLDFGVAKIGAPPGAEATRLTGTGGLLGSPLYMSPEQAQGSEGVDRRTDLWSLGSVLYCALAGRAPFQHVGSVGKLILAICGSAPPPLGEVAPWVRPEVAAVVSRALALDPAHRYPSAAAMLEAIRPLCGGDPALHEEMLGGLPEEARAVVARPAQGEASGQATTLAAEAPPRLGRRAAIAAAAVAAAAIAIVSAAGYARPQAAEPAVLAATTASAAPGPSAAAASAAPIARVTLAVAPEDAAVEVDGAAAEVRSGGVEISGALGSGHRVRVAAKGRAEVTAEVFVTEKGAVPERLEAALPRPAARPAKPPASAAARPTTTSTQPGGGFF